MAATLTESPPQIETGQESEERKSPLYNVVLLDDNEHSYDYVIEMLTRLFYFGESRAFRHAVEVDTTGRTIILTADLEEAQMAKDLIHGYGADPRMPISKGSMTAVIEPASKGAA